MVKLLNEKLTLFSSYTNQKSGTLNHTIWKKSDFRIFKFNRLIDLEITSKSFEPTTYPKVEELENKTYNEIVLKFSKNISHRVYDEFDVNDVKEEDNHLIVSVKFPEDYWVVGYLLSYGSFVEVISPTSLRKILEEEGKKIYEMYKCWHKLSDYRWYT